MIDLEHGVIVRGTNRVRIVDFKVWWITPFGLCETIHEAKEVMEKNDLPLQLAVRPVPVAIGEGKNEYEPYIVSG
jgi:hypothetical protein